MVTNMVLAGPMTGTQPNACIIVRNGDTLLLSNINATFHGPFLVGPPASNNTFALTITNCLFDSAKGSSAAMFIPGGGVFDTLISNTWFGLSAGHGLVIQPAAPSGTVNGMEVTGCQFCANAGGSGVRITGAGAGVSGINIIGGRSEANSSNGAHVDGTPVNGITFNGFRAGNYGGRGGNAGAGILTAGGLDHYVITNCSLYGNTGSPLSDTATGTNKLVFNNLVT